MNKKFRVSLIVLIAVILILAVAIPALAHTQSTSCFLTWKAYDKDDNIITVSPKGEGMLEVNDTTLTKTCTGDIPLGGSIGTTTYFDLDQMRDYLDLEFGGPFIIGPDDMGGDQMTTDYKGLSCTSYGWSVRVKNNGDFSYMALYDIEECE